jgi:hypothetical protein
MGPKVRRCLCSDTQARATSTKVNAGFFMLVVSYRNVHGDRGRPRCV